MDYVLSFVYFYPITMAFVWMFGTLLFQSLRDKNSDKVPDLPENPPMFSILVPCHNEEECLTDTMTYLANLDYPNYEVIAIDDASTDGTAAILAQLQKKYSFMRVVSLKTNQGKGTALNMAALVSKGEYLVGIDADALLDKNALRWFMWHFQSSPRVGAITGNPKVRNRTTVIAKIQVGEYSTIIGMIKRAQRILGKIYTVSGVIVAFRKKALERVGFWSNNMVTEDIDISWKLQLDHWDIRYEARVLCWILVPETLKGIWKQRLRWAQGGNEVLLKYSKCLLQWKNRRIWPLYIESSISVIWCYCLGLTMVVWLLGWVVPLPPYLAVRSIVPEWNGILLASVCLLQMLCGVYIDSKYDKTMYKIIPWLIWYPAIYWMINCLVTIFAMPKAIFKRKTELAVWESPDRGI